MRDDTKDACLHFKAADQHGYFTAKQAQDCGLGRPLLTYHTRSGRFQRIYRGIYRLRDYPTSPHDEVYAACLAVGPDPDTAVVSHESALDLLDLSDVIPNEVHLTVSRARRDLPRLPGVRIHTTTRF